MSRSETLLEYCTSYHHPNDPDVSTQVVTADLLEEAVGYYVECMTEEERSVMLSDFLYEQMYDQAKQNDPIALVQDIVKDYIKDTM